MTEIWLKIWYDQDMTNISFKIPVWPQDIMTKKFKPKNLSGIVIWFEVVKSMTRLKTNLEHES